MYLQVTSVLLRQARFWLLQSLVKSCFSNGGDSNCQRLSTNEHQLIHHLARTTTPTDVLGGTRDSALLLHLEESCFHTDMERCFGVPLQLLLVPWRSVSTLTHAPHRPSCPLGGWRAHPGTVAEKSAVTTAMSISVSWERDSKGYP